MSQRELAEHYVLEIAARAQTVQNRCDRLLEEDFFSEAPPAFARTVRRMCEFLAKASVAVYNDIDWTQPASEIEDDLRILRNTDRIVKIVAQELRYVEGARTERLPWSIVASFEKLVAAFLPDIQIMLRAMWQYNYAFHMLNQGAVYRRYLAPYADYVPDVDLESVVFCEMQRPFHIISFPSLEQKHILLHCLLGHEIGHLLVGRFITKEREAAFVATIQPDVAKLAEEELSTFPATNEDVRKALREQIVLRFLQEALFHWRRALEELLSDATGIMLFGPAALFSTLDLAIQTSLDVAPSADTDYYPPWRMRLRENLRLLDEPGGWFPVADALFRGDAERARRVNDRVLLVRSMVGIESDKAEISKSRLAVRAYAEVEKTVAEGHAYLLDDCGLKSHRPSAATLYERLPVLVERLDQRIPPNAFEQTVGDTRVASFAEILNAAWFHKVSMSPFDQSTGKLDPNGVAARNLMNNLTLKAIEFANLATEYTEWKPTT